MECLIQHVCLKPPRGGKKSQVMTTREGVVGKEGNGKIVAPFSFHIVDRKGG